MHVEAVVMRSAVTQTWRTLLRQMLSFVPGQRLQHYSIGQTLTDRAGMCECL